MKMSKILGSAALASLLVALPAFAQDAAPEVVEEVATIDTGDTAWMLVSTIIVIFMTLPGLALFYGGLVRSKNVLSILSQVIGGFCLIALLWVAYGFSLAFTGPAEGGLSAFVGGLDALFLSGIGPDTISATLSTIPELVFAVFQLTFAAITGCLIIGGIAERMKFGAVMVFLALWFTFAYIPLAHMVWGGGLIGGWGALDFAGGTVVHINSGVAALVAAIVLGPRLGYLKEPIAPHNLTFTFIGASILWVGWFGFNAGSAGAADGIAAQAFLNTITAPAAAALAWGLGERITRGHASLLGFVSGAVAGLVAITPAAGFVGTVGAIVIGALGGFICLWAVVYLKPLLKYDDSLDVFGIHGIGGIVGALATGIFAAPSLGGLGGEDFDMASQFITQLLAVVLAIVWVAIVTLVSLMIVKAIFGGLRVSEAGESDGLDLTSHGERAYN